MSELLVDFLVALGINTEDIDLDSIEESKDSSAIVLDYNYLDIMRKAINDIAYLYNSITVYKKTKIEVTKRDYYLNNWAKVVYTVEAVDEKCKLTVSLKGFEAMLASGKVVLVDSIKSKTELGVL